MADDTPPVIDTATNEALIQLWGTVVRLSGRPLNEVAEGLRENVHALIAAVRAENGMNIQMTTDELDWVKHAASLRGLTPVEYVRRAINASLRHDGVDAVLLRQSDDDVCYCRKNPCICFKHDEFCESELTSHGRTPCRCEERTRA